MALSARMHRSRRRRALRRSREKAKKEKQSEAREKIFARAAKARFKKKTKG
jgi:hypothetical protein